jgi:hypothetical protein
MQVLEIPVVLDASDADLKFAIISVQFGPKKKTLHHCEVFL